MLYFILLFKNWLFGLVRYWYYIYIMKEIIEIIKKSDDYLLGRIQEKASFIELEELIRLRLKN